MKQKLHDTVVMAIYTARESDQPLAEIIDEICEQGSIPHSDIHKVMESLKYSGHIVPMGKGSLYSVNLTDQGLEYAKELSKGLGDKIAQLIIKGIPEAAKILLQIYFTK